MIISLMQNVFLYITPCLIFYAPIVTGFVAPSQQQQHQIMSHSLSISSTSLTNSPLFSPESDDKEPSEFDGFNPFQPGAKIQTKGGFGIISDEKRKQPALSTPGGQISPRQWRMKELTTSLLVCLSDDESVSELLQSNEDFLMDQLNNLDAVLEADSVYTPDMKREERFQRYRQVMEDRIKSARAPVAKKALGALMDFVLGRE